MSGIEKKENKKNGYNINEGCCFIFEVFPKLVCYVVCCVCKSEKDNFWDGLFYFRPLLFIFLVAVFLLVDVTGFLKNNLKLHVCFSYLYLVKYIVKVYF